ncbi:MAG: anthranilate phosphoribosyltransferase [Verrucomicrobiales bacterium]
MKELTQQLESGIDLTPDQIGGAAAILLDENADAEAKGAFLKALAAKGETPEEVAAFVEAFLGYAGKPALDAAALSGPVIDVCGTGGDKLDLFNVSTTGMFILAGGGAFVAKHGNRSITSKSGGADVLEALGVRIDLPPPQFGEVLAEAGCAFLFAPVYHPAFKAVAPVRQALAKEGQRTVFNILGPLLNPARPGYQLIGVFDDRLRLMFAEILRRLGRQGAWIAHGNAGGGQGMDEVSTLGKTHIAQLKGGDITEFVLDPADLGIAAASLAELRGGDAAHNAALLEGILDGCVRGPQRDLALLNAAAGFCACGLAGDIAAGWARAKESLESGAAEESLRKLQQLSSEA